MKKRFIPAICMLLVLLIGCSCAGSQTKPEPIVTKAPEPAADAPEQTGALSFQTVTLSGEPIDSSIIGDYDLVIVNCWAEWCGPCVGEMPELEKLHQNYPNVLLLGVLSFSDDLEGAKQTVRDTGVTYPVFEPSGSLVERISTFNAIPATMFFDKEGRELCDPVIGSQNYEGWKKIVEDLLP